MKFNQISSIDSKKGDYIILSDYGSEGLSIHSQYKNLEDAILNLGGYGGEKQTIVKLVEFEVDWERLEDLEEKS